MKFGSCEIHPLVERRFRLDGGTMFGVVPRKIWGRLIPPDENNLVPMETNLFVIRTGENTILCDTGFGDCLSLQEEKIYAVSGETNIECGLAELGLSVDEIDVVFLTHLHTDHAGGAVKNSDGNIVPRFPRARYIVQSIEWEDAMHPNERTSAVYIPERLMPLEKSGQLALIDGDVEILPGIRAVRTGGHTPGHQAIEAYSGDDGAVYYADIVPSSYHVRVPYVASVDLFPLDTMTVKRDLVKRLLADNLAIAFDHDTEIKIGRLVEQDGKVVVNKIE
ncbi:MAG: MBL fold metallo-hydrolase [candidate division Zixibacteria bacterium]|nr:MBL fold metallo-hydrolase [candidate division Zixibacteria bacterium]